MKSVLVVLAAVMAVAIASECNTLRRIKVKQQWAQAYSAGVAREDFGEAVWKALVERNRSLAVFQQAPESVKLLYRVKGFAPKSPEFKAHVARVNGALDMSISLLDHPATLKAALAHLNEAHKDRKIPSNYFDVFVDALHAVVPAALGRCFDLEAWQACTAIIVDGIRH